MDEISLRRKKLFSGAAFSCAILYNGDASDGVSPSFAYFSGCGIDGSYLVLKRNRSTLFVNGMNVREAKQDSYYPVKVMGREAAKQLRKECGTGKIGFSAAEMPAARYLALRKRAKLKLVDATEKMLQARGGKTDNEKRALAVSASIARRILANFNPWKHRTEEGAASALKIAALSSGVEISFEPIVATGKNSSMPHHKPAKRKLGDFVLVDFGVKYNGYCSDFTRCYFRGKCARERAAYGKCQKIFGEMKYGLANCKNGEEVTQLSERLMTEHGLPKMIHSIGHGIGLDVHEYPHLSLKSRDSLQGAVLAIEPAAYFADFGVRYEEMLLNTKKGWKKL